MYGYMQYIYLINLYVYKLYTLYLYKKACMCVYNTQLNIL